MRHGVQPYQQLLVLTGTLLATVSDNGGAYAWIASSIPHPTTTTTTSTTTTTRLYSSMLLLPDAVTSLLAGSVAGAAGVGFAFPLDTVKVKQQVDAAARCPEQQNLCCTSSSIEYLVSHSGEVSMVKDFQQQQQQQQPSALSTARDIWESQGIAGFYGGVRTSMMGQGIIKATAFSVNAAVLERLAQPSNLIHLSSFGITSTTGTITCTGDLIIAAATAGFITAFLASPVDRIKVLMQTNNSKDPNEKGYKSEYDCLQSVLHTEGWKGLLGTGLVPTICREVPACTLYFLLYATLTTTYASALVLPYLQWSPGVLPTGSGASLCYYSLEPLAPAIFGALAGAICVVPVHPVDVVKTIVQHGTADSSITTTTSTTTTLQQQQQQQQSWQHVVSDIYQTQGIRGFWEGLSSRMGRAAINHSATFALYDFMMHQR